jgi:hypothetical protein
MATQKLVVFIDLMEIIIADEAIVLEYLVGFFTRLFSQRDKFRPARILRSLIDTPCLNQVALRSILQK